MARKPTKKKTTRRTAPKRSPVTKALMAAGKRKASPKKKKSTARKPRAKTVATKAEAKPATKSKRVRVEGAIGALDDVLHGIGAEKAELIRQRVRSILNSFR